MRRKLRKSMSWLLTVSMIFSLVFGAIPTASAASTQGKIISIDSYSEALTDTNSTTMTVEVRDIHADEGAEALDSFEVPNIRKSASTVEFSITQEYLAQYQISGIAISPESHYTVTVDAPQHQSVYFTTGVGENPTLTIYVTEASNVLKLKNETDDIGTITYKSGDTITDIYIYLNNEEEPVAEFKDIGLQSSHSENFVLHLNSGYYYGDATNSLDCAPGGATWESPYQYLIINQPLKENTLSLYFYTFEDGVNLDFERTINRGNVIGVDDACKSLTLNYTYGNRDWEINYDQWEQQYTI